MPSLPDTKSYYTVLQINQDATEQEIRKSYKRLAMLQHPDKNIGDFTNACAAFKKLNTAFSVLSDPLSRAKYDKSLEQPVSYRETETTKSTRSDFSNDLSDDFSNDETTTSAPGSPRRPEISNFKSSGATYCRSGSSSVYHHSDDGDDYKQQRDKDDKEKEWRKGAWLDEAIRKSIDNVEKYLKEMKLMADDDYTHDEWSDIKMKVNVETRLLDRMRKDRDDLYGTLEGDEEKEWRKGAWLDEAIRKSMDNVEKYLKEMKLMADDDYTHDERSDIKMKVNVEMRLLNRMRKDRDDLYGTLEGDE